jgi:hypothetical protein
MLISFCNEALAVIMTYVLFRCGNGGALAFPCVLTGLGCRCGCGVLFAHAETTSIAAKNRMMSRNGRIRTTSTHDLDVDS